MSSYESSARRPLYTRSPKAAQELWLAMEDRMPSHEPEGSVALFLPEAHPQLPSRDSPGSADLKGHGHSSPSGWLRGFAGLDDTFASVPGLMRVPSSGSMSESESDNDSSLGHFYMESNPPSTVARQPAKKRVSFATSVDVRIIPHVSSLRFSQRRKMYASSEETERNLERNEKEFWFDGNDWRNATEEKDMGVDPVTGELVHPAHEFEFGDREGRCKAEWDRQDARSGDHGSALWL